MRRIFTSHFEPFTNSRPVQATEFSSPDNASFYASGPAAGASADDDHIVVVEVDRGDLRDAGP